MSKHIFILVVVSLVSCIKTEQIIEQPIVELIYSAEERTRIAANVASSLEASGYTVRPGQLDFFRIEDCAFLDSCYGNNPSSPYGLMYFEPFAGDNTEYVSDLSALNIGDASAAYKLKSSDAIVMLLRTPPLASYLGFTPYVFRSLVGESYRDIFASLTDTLNNFNLKHSGSSAFNAETVVIYSADLETVESVKNAIVAQGVPEEIINTVALPSDLYRFGVGRDSDSFIPLMRIAFFANEDEGDAYMNSSNAEVMQVRLPEARTNFIPMPVTALVPYPRNDIEQQYVPLIEKLVEAIIARYPQYSVDAKGGFVLALEGHECIDGFGECLGDNRDTPYIVSLGGLLQNDRNRFSVAIGVNHAKVGTAHYSNLAFYDPSKLMGVAGLGDEQYTGSATKFLPDEQGIEDLFVVFYARDCSAIEHLCIEVPIDFPGIPLDTRVTVAERAYVYPGSTVGIYADDLVKVRTLHFSK